MTSCCLDNTEGVRALQLSLEAFKPLNEEEALDKQTILSALAFAEGFTEDGRCLFDRSWPAHFTTSAWVVNPERTKTLMVYHNIYDSWSWIGGHADGNRNLAEVAQKELAEETGLCKARLITDDIFSCEVLTVDGHQKKGAYVPSHLHLNITYCFEALDTDEAQHVLRIAPQENSGVAWFGLDEALEKSSEPWMVEHIYRKLVARTRSMG